MTHADVMLDSPGTEDALRRLRELPWISVGWHIHFWGKPVLDSARLPSLVLKETGRFRHDIRTASDLDHHELAAEFRAQLERCLAILGRAPDTGGDFLGDTETPFVTVMQKICDDYGIPTHYCRKNHHGTFIEPGEKWKNRKIVMAAQQKPVKFMINDRISDISEYDPLEYYFNDEGNLFSFGEDWTVVQAWHPGYVDYYVLRDGDHGLRAKFYTDLRVIEVEALTSPKLKEWIKEKHIELVNYRDALYGTHEYQNHLRNLGSDLCIL
jgi:predicted glycoside hydrolase/deacetylase ChbG (UPF0249 family)